MVHEQYFSIDGRSFIYRTNKTGPKIEPWGTPREIPFD